MAVKKPLARIVQLFVPERGLEPPSSKALVPKTSVFTNFTTQAYLIISQI